MRGISHAVVNLGLAAPSRLTAGLSGQLHQERITFVWVTGGALLWPSDHFPCEGLGVHQVDGEMRFQGKRPRLQRRPAVGDVFFLFLFDDVRVVHPATTQSLRSWVRVSNFAALAKFVKSVGLEYMQPSAPESTTCNSYFICVSQNVNILINS